MDSLAHLEEENFRLKGVEQDLNRTKQNMADDQDMHDRLKERMSGYECQLAERAVELQHKDDAIRQIDIDVQEMQ